jgi:chloramphenicol 3-O-phosphotransferase
MTLVFIHGMAASGKLTIARELAELTGMPVFHNHLVVDAVLSVFDFATEPFIKLRHEMWMAMFHEAVRLDRSLIFTFTPERSVPGGFVPELTQLVRGAGGRILFVRLLCGREEQERRIENPSRAEFRKLRSLEVLRQMWDEGEGPEALPPSDLTVDTEQLSPREAAKAIAKVLNLPTSFPSYRRPQRKQ